MFSILKSYPLTKYFGIGDNLKKIRKSPSLSSSSFSNKFSTNDWRSSRAAKSSSISLGLSSFSFLDFNDRLELRFRARNLSKIHNKNLFQKYFFIFYQLFHLITHSFTFFHIVYWDIFIQIQFLTPPNALLVCK